MMTKHFEEYFELNSALKHTAYKHLCDGVKPKYQYTNSVQNWCYSSKGQSLRNPAGKLFTATNSLVFGILSRLPKNGPKDFPENLKASQIVHHDDMHNV